MKHYAWAKGFRSRGLDAQACGTYLDELSRKHGNITPAMLVREAVKKRSPIHRFFDWNDKTAAAEWRLAQARLILRCIKVVVTIEENAEPEIVRAFVHIKESGGDPTYIPLKSVLSHEEWTMEMLDTAKKELAAFRDKYAMLKDLCSIMKAIDEIL